VEEVRERLSHVSLWHPVLVGAGMIGVSAPLHGPTKNVNDRSRFCVKHEAGPHTGRGESPAETFADSGKGEWVLQGYPPLIDTHGGTVFEQANYTGKWLSKVRMRGFRRDYELDVEYRFDESGRLTETVSDIQQGNNWHAEASLYSDGQGGVREPEVTYSHEAGGKTISQPEEARHYTQMFRSVKLLKTSDEIPCAGLLKEAEKMNATQK
jgi:hypothetical protein